MATIEIQLKAYAKIVGTDRNCQVDLKRSVFQIDRDVNEIKIPLQAIVKLRKPIVAPSPQAASSSILPAPQTAQMSLPTIPKLLLREDTSHSQEPMTSTFNIPITVGNERKMVKTTLRYKKAPKAPVTEIETQTEEPAKMPLTDLYPRDPVARALMLHQDRLQPVKQALREIKTKISNLRLEQKTTRYTTGEGRECYIGEENSACPFIQYLMHQEKEGPIDMNTPISKIVGPDYRLAFEHESVPGRSSMAAGLLDVRVPSIRISTVSGAEKRDSQVSDESKIKSGASAMSGVGGSQKSQMDDAVKEAV